MKLTTALILGVFTIASTQALAGHRNHDEKHHRDWHKSEKKASHHIHKMYVHREQQHYGHSYRDQSYAEVVHVQPIYHSYTRPLHDTSCLYRAPERVHSVSYTGTILGAVIGGALGHRIGDAHGDPGAAAIAGGLLGAAIGRNIDHNVNYNQGLRVAGPCRVKHHQETVLELVEYEVTYRYNGRVHHARMDHDPGEWVKLDVDISPA